jgi:hypothetical protein
MITPPAILVGLWYLLRNKSRSIQKTVIFAITLLNLLQHMLKIYIYPQYWGEPFGARSTAYNMCAFLIMASPFIFLFGSELWRNFITYVGTVAGSMSLCVTYWMADPLEEQLRFVICHGLLLITSCLPALLGIYKINCRKCWRLPFVFYACLMILIVNDVITYSLGIAGDVSGITLHEFLLSENPCWAMCAPIEYPIAGKIAAFLSPKAFEGVPILWLAIPFFLIVTLAAIGLGSIFDNKRFKADLSAALAYVKTKFNHIKSRINSKGE